ncbi:DUF6880 family protein [Roseobacter sp. GAI101]|uniref:DUF6880 family protein n=1 Tax=Roseobacter sp. (strain GAI101) TaxID=391589 RepID=UPI0001872282|nr:DUF6880 family protein [Roseobacter sp. GAI101]EEB82737.1 conserved hypothetical protein [Roseobacter sp. GAI101]
MSKKTLNQANLAALGAHRLAALLIEVSTGSADIKRRLRLELSHNLGPEELARDVRKRLVSIRRSTSFVGWRKRKALIKDLTTQAEMITEKIAPEAPAEAFELLWQFIEIAPSVYERVDDSRGDVGDVFRTALSGFVDIAQRAGLDPQALAMRVWDAVRDNRYGEFDGIIGLLAPALGDAGLEQLKTLVMLHKGAPVKEVRDHAALQFLRDLRSSGGNFAADQKTRLVKMCLQEIAAAQGDIDAYIAQYSAQDLTRPRIAAKVAGLLAGAARPQDALDVLAGADPVGRDADWDAAYIANLLALDRVAEAQSHRWEVFCETLDVHSLRDYLKVLPDFDDIEFEDAAKAHAAQFPDMTVALRFFLDWPDLPSAARLIQDRASELDGDLYQILTPAAEALRNRHPFAAVLVWRAMIDHALWDGRSTRYGHAADHLMDCAAADAEIADYGKFLSHDAYVARLREVHRHKSSFWARVP